ncbi:Zinc finger CCCH domain-containing protein 47 [Bienertia sinuspersici]
MCSGSKSKTCSCEEVMEVEVHDKDSVGDHQNSSLLLELSATNDLISFKNAVEKEGYDMNEARLWYGGELGLKRWVLKREHH